MKKETVLVLGDGFLGNTFKRHGYNVLGKKMFYVECNNVSLTWDYIRKNLSKYNCEVIINCIGKSNTRWCEIQNNFDEALVVNGMFPGILSEVCDEKDIKLVHISTGCLYDITDPPQKETDFTVTHCNYTLTKKLGELGVNPMQELIIRPRLLFGDVVDKNNLLCKMHKFKRLVDAPDSLTSTDVIVKAIEALLEADEVGYYNVACDGHISIFEIGRMLGFPSANNPAMTPEELRKQENLYLVNNTLDLSKLKQYYQPPNIIDELMRCWMKLKETKQ